MGVDRLFVIGVTTPRRETSIPMGHTPGASFLMGKALDALMLDHIEHDLEEMRLINEILSDAYLRLADRLPRPTRRHGRVLAWATTAPPTYQDLRATSQHGHRAARFRPPAGVTVHG